MLEFLVLILYPEKPARVMVTVGNMIFGAYTEERGGLGARDKGRGPEIPGQSG